MCKLCKEIPCNQQCPNYKTPPPSHYCSVCKDGIYPGEEFIVNDNGDYAHWECVDYGRDLVEWLGYKIRIMED